MDTALDMISISTKKKSIMNLELIKVNSQGREEMHSVLDKATATLRLKKYEMFMRWMIVWFANHSSQGLI